MYGIFIDGEHDPYVHSYELDQANELARHNRKLGHQADVMILDPVCVCGQPIPGWFDVDEFGDLLDRPCHSACKPSVDGMALADEWF